DLSNGEVYTCVASAWSDTGSSIKGAAGAAGANGSSVVTSTAGPSNPCTTADTDVDLSNGEVYTCVASAWSDTGSSIKGAAGAAGANGSSVVTSAAVPSNPCTTGATDVDLSNGEVYTCVASAWSDTASS